MSELQAIPEDTGIRGKALCQFKDRSLLLYCAGEFQLICLDDKHVINRFVLPIANWKKIASKFRLTERLIHAEARWAYPINEHIAFIFYADSLWRVNAQSGEYSKENVSVKGKPLSFTEIKGLKSFDDAYVIGDYWNNSHRDLVRIYRMSVHDNDWEVAYTFPPAAVRHIHAIVPDSLHDCLYILTGDEDEESGIWIAYNNFSRVEPLYLGKQSYRSCQLFRYNKDILYLTDAPSEENYLFCIRNSTVIQEQRLRGSCIYGMIQGNKGFFSTTCEPAAHAHNQLEYWLTNKPGSGIQDVSIDVFAILDGKVHPVKSFVHDRLPLRLFQYATATFANSMCDEVYFTPMCVKEYDQHIFRIVGEKEDNE